MLIIIILYIQNYRVIFYYNDTLIQIQMLININCIDQG